MAGKEGRVQESAGKVTAEVPLVLCEAKTQMEAWNHIDVLQMR